MRVGDAVRSGEAIVLVARINGRQRRDESGDHSWEALEGRWITNTWLVTH